jgi:hypothetical protein
MLAINSACLANSESPKIAADSPMSRRLGQKMILSGLVWELLFSLAEPYSYNSHDKLQLPGRGREPWDEF